MKYAVHAMFAAFCAVCLIGCVLIYFVDTDPSLDASVDGDGNVVYSVSGTLPESCRYIIVNGTEDINRLYLYMDRDHASLYSHDTIGTFYSEFVKILAKRGFGSVEYIDAGGLSALMSDTSSADGKAVIVMSGILPDTVKTDDSNDVVTDWISAGGILYWNGPAIGAYREYGGEVLESVPVIPSEMYNDASSGTPHDGLEYSDVASDFTFTFDRIERGFRSDYPSSRVFGASDGTYSSYSVVRMGSGDLHVFGWSLTTATTDQLCAIADMMVCGMGYDTIVVEKKVFEKGLGDLTGSADMSAMSWDRFYLTVGKPETQHGLCLIR
ncbi:MAG: hypothetical protein ACI4Q9_04485 [Candidatus Methanomethylophilaceae archaeon]